MDTKKIFFNLEKNLLLIPAIVSVVVIYALTPFGAASSGDSLYYYAAAINIHSGNGLTLPNFNLFSNDFIPMTTWPPLYPLFLSLFLSGNEIEIAARYSNMLCLVIASTVFLILCKKLTKWTLATLVTIFFVIQPPILTIYTYGWSEALFMPLVLLSYYFAINAGENENLKTKLFNYSISVAFITMACCTRYIGVAFFFAFLIMAALDLWQSRRNILFFLSIFTGIFILGFAPIIIYNYLQTGYFSGTYRGISETHIIYDILLLFKSLKLNLFNFSDWADFGILVFLALTISTYYIKIKQSRLAGIAFLLNVSTLSNHSRISWSSLLWLSCYVIFLIAMRNIQNFDEIDTRLISIVIPFIILFILALATTKNLLKLKSPIIIFTALWMVFQSIYSIGVFRGSIQSWHLTGLPNLPMNKNDCYNNFNRKKAAASLYGDLSLNVNSLVLSDSPRPIIINYYLKPSIVKSLPADLTPEAIRIVNSIGNKGGILLISTPNGMETIKKIYSDTVNVRWINSGILGVNAVIDLPLPELKTNAH